MQRMLAALLATGLLGATGVAFAADHRDGPGVDADATTDITDVYAWMNPTDASKLYLVMDVQGANTGATTAIKWPNSALYALHVSSGSKFQDPAAMKYTIICQFDNAATQGFQCWGPGGEYVADATGNTAGKASASGKMKVAALVRNDPFWFNIRGFLGVAGLVKSVAAGLKFDGSGCPAIDTATSGALVGTLASDGAKGPAKDDFGPMGLAPVGCSTGTCDGTAKTNGNVMSIVIALDTTLATPGGKIVSVWGSTNKVGP